MKGIDDCEGKDMLAVHNWKLKRKEVSKSKEKRGRGRPRCSYFD